MDYIRRISAVAGLFENADHVDVKTVESNVNLREFTAGLIGYQPAWIDFLYRVRAVFVRFLGMKQDFMPTALKLRPEDLPMDPGDTVSIWTVSLASEDEYWAAHASDKHLAAHLVAAVESMPDGLNRFHVATIVHYRNWAGPVYFNVIRPFHHLVVRSMMNSAARGLKSD